MRRLFLVPFIAFAVNTASCSGQTVVHLPLREAARRLAASDITFIVDGPPEKMHEVARINPAAPFYAALLVEADSRPGATRQKTIVLLHEALKSPVTRAAALRKLADYDSDAAFRRYNQGFDFSEGGAWLDAFRLRAEYALLKAAGASDLPRDSAPFFFDGPLGGAQHWLYAAFQAEVQQEFTAEDEGESTGKESDAEKDEDERKDEDAGTPPAALRTAVELLIETRFALEKYEYQTAFRCFREALEKDGARLVLAHAGLLSDIGKAYQYAAAREGLDKFTAWEKALPKDAPQDTRYRLLYYAGRMARQLKRPKDAIDYFDRALPHAPNGLQKDACIWYVLETAYSVKEENILEYLGKYAKEWDDASYFSDILEKFAAWAAKKRRFDLIRTAYFLISDYSDRETRAQYAYISGRALEYGLLTKRLDEENAASFYKAAYNDARTGNYGVPAFYYRALAAKRLDWQLNLDELITEDTTPKPAISSSTMAFLEGFFSYGAAALSYPYVREVRDGLSLPELRLIAEKLAGAKLWHNAINLTIYYMKHKDFRLTRRDLELRYPCGYADIVERFAQQAKIEAPLLFALIRRESVFNAGVRSRVGAWGLTQLMEKTGTEMARILAKNGGEDYAKDGLNLLDPETNVHLGALYYRQLLDMTESPTLAILAYNGGIGRIRRWRRAAQNLSDDLFLETVEFTETRTYGRGVLGDEAVYRYLYFD